MQDTNRDSFYTRKTPIVIMDVFFFFFFKTFNQTPTGLEIAVEGCVSGLWHFLGIFTYIYFIVSLNKWKFYFVLFVSRGTYIHVSIDWTTKHFGRVLSNYSLMFAQLTIFVFWIVQRYPAEVPYKDITQKRCKLFDQYTCIEMTQKTLIGCIFIFTSVLIRKMDQISRSRNFVWTERNLNWTVHCL